MKKFTFQKIILLLVLTVLFSPFLHAQVYTGDLSLSNQTQVDTFSYTSVTGNLAITGADITNLDSLSSLTTVGGDLLIDSNPLLTNVDGLSSFTTVVGDFYISNNPVLTNLDSLSSLTSVGEYLYIDNNALLTNFDGLSSLTTVGGVLRISNNPVLTNIDGLSSLTTVGASLYMHHNSLLTNVNGLSSLEYVSSDLYIRENPVLTNVDGLSSLTTVGGDLYFYLDLALTNVDGLYSLTSLSEVHIYSNPVLTEFCGLYPLLSGGGLSGTYYVSDNGINPTQLEIIGGGACPIFAVCKSAVVYLDGDGTGTLAVSDIDGGSTAGFGIALLELSTTDFTCENWGDNEVTLTVTDSIGNTDVCTAIVTVEDTISPIALCQDTTVWLDILGAASIDSTFIDDGSSDACGILTMALSTTDFSCSDVGISNSVIMTVTDINGNVSTCPSTVTVLDTLAPVITPHPLEIYLNGIGVYVLTEDDIEQISAGASDNCSSFEELDIQVFPRVLNCFNTGRTFPLQVIANDLNGNPTVSQTTVTVYDTISPVAVCQNVELFLDEKGEAYVSPQMVNSDKWNTLLAGGVNVFTRGSYDACGIQSMSLDKKSYNCFDLGENLVTLTLTDRSGNMSSCTSIVDVIDDIAPVISEISDIVLTVASSECTSEIDYPEIIVEDNCDVTLEQISGLGENGLFPIGTTIETWRATDEGGNTATVSFEVTITSSNAQPTLDEISDLVVHEDTYSASVTLTGIGDGGDCEDQDIAVSAVSDNEALVSSVLVDYTSAETTGTIMMVIVPGKSGSAEITVTVEDSEGGTISESFTFTVYPVNDPPFLVTPVADQVVHASFVLKVPLSSVLGEMFDDVDDDELTITALTEGLNSLPSWATMSGDTLVCEPMLVDTGCVNIVITATDSSGATATDTFEICVDGYPVSIGDLGASQFEVQMYPNPTKGKVNLELSSGIYKVELSVMDIAGKVVLKQQYTAAETITFDMSGKVSGMYFVKMNINGMQVIKKLIVNK